jgi:hypothetical protein
MIPKLYPDLNKVKNENFFSPIPSAPPLEEYNVDNKTNFKNTETMPNIKKISETNENDQELLFFRILFSIILIVISFIINKIIPSYILLILGIFILNSSISVSVATIILFIMYHTHFKIIHFFVLIFCIINICLINQKYSQFIDLGIFIAVLGIIYSELRKKNDVEAIINNVMYKYMPGYNKYDP